KQMHALAFGAKCGALTASGLADAAGAASRPSSRSSEARAARPIPLAEVARKLRRQRRACSSAGLMVGGISAGQGGISLYLLYRFRGRDEGGRNGLPLRPGILNEPSLDSEHPEWPEP